ncbi:N-acetyltransferase [Nonomuraea sp. NPDC050790]|uniref:N-acetyltransferase n=1 Tax=Nonomuraea sp. NPDC050790 TaxID=3364371 RepID=UPI00379E8C84
MSLRITTLAERPEFAESLWDMDTAWPEFMLNDPIADLFYAVATSHYADYVLVADDPAEPGRLAARACMIPFTARDGDLPDDGWDAVIRRGWLAREGGRTPDAVSALEITIRKDLLGGGLSAHMVAAMRARAARLGFAELVAPVRPSQKHLEPHTPTSEYAFRTRGDGLPYDAWLRVHVRAGGRVEKVAQRSMTISGTLGEWRGWTGLPFDVDGAVEVPGALVPVHVDVTHDHAVYVEPNIWVRHPL